jgi:arylsulfatase A-like enzyme
MSDRPSAGEIAKKGFLGGLGWGAAVGTVHLAVGVALIVVLNVPPMTWFAAKSVVIEIAIAIAAGVALSPVFLAPNGLGRWLHPAALALLWLGLERWVAVDPTRLQMWVAPTLVGLVVFGLGSAAAKRRPGPVIALAVAVPLLLVSVPLVKYRISGYGAASTAERGEARPGAPDVLFIVMDTTRAKSVSAYGYERQTTPRFDAIAGEGALYTEANSAATWSLPAHASLFTGHYPSSHEAHGETRALDDRLPTLAEAMVAQGYRALGFSANPYISDTYGLTRGFDWLDKAWISGEGGRQFSFVYRLIDRLGFAARDKGGAQVVDNLRQWMGSRAADDGPAFVFVNFLEAHFPFNQLPHEFLYAYTDAPASTLADASQTAFGVQFGRQLTPEEFQRIEAPIRDMYDGGIRYTDHLVGEVVDLWRERGTLDDTVVVILGDHGEMVGEHGSFGHVTSVYQPDLHVPLTVRYPAKIPAGTVVREPVSTVGVYATIMDLLGTVPPGELQAGSLVPGYDGARGPVIAERFEEEMLASRFAEGTANGRGPLLLPHGRYRTYREGRYKLAEYSLGGGPWLFDLVADPGEARDLAATEPEKLAEMRETLGSIVGSLPLRPLDAPIGTTVEKPVLGCDECQRLLALGYVSDCDDVCR